MVRARSTRRARRPTRSAVIRGARGYTRTRGVYGRFLPSSRTELKCYDMVTRDCNNGSSFNATGQVLSLLGTAALGIARGTAMTERIGNRITVKSILVSGTIWGNAVAVVGNLHLFAAEIYIVLDNQPNGALATPVDFLAQHAGLGGLPALPANVAVTGDFRNLINMRRFTVLAKHRYVPSGVFGYDSTNFITGPKHFDIYKKCNIPVEYTATGAANSGYTAEIVKNQILVFAFSGGSAMAMSFSSRLRYADE